MIFKHFFALLELRYRLTFNQIKKAGKFNLILYILAVVLTLVGSVASFFIGIFGGSVWFADASVSTISITWNIIVGSFMVLWVIGMMIEVQQTEIISIDKLLHLPISPKGAFFLNYASSFINSTFIMFMPLMIGLSIGLIFAKGFQMALAIPLVIGFLFFVTTLSYQLRGWLAKMMKNKRTRGTIIAVVTIVFVLISQIPFLITRSFDESKDERREQQRVQMVEAQELAKAEVDAKLESGEVLPEAAGKLLREMGTEISERFANQRKQERAERTKQWLAIVETADTYVPPGWLPLGIVRAAEHKLLPGLLGICAMFGIGLVSLVFSYRSSMQSYTGASTGKRRKKKFNAVANKKSDEFLFKQIPFVSEQVSAIAVSGIRGLLRAPESKMALIFPFIIALIAGSFLFTNNDFTIQESLRISNTLRPLIPLSLITMTMFGITSFQFNLFGMDRDGFRAYMLSPIERKNILIGKNLAVAPFAIGICLGLVLIGQFLVPQSLLAFLAALIQIPAVYLLYCLLGNVLSIFFPMGIKRGSMQPANPRLLPVLLMIIGGMAGPALLMFPSTIAAGIPILLEAWLDQSMGWLYLLLTLIQFGATAWLYVWLVRIQGDWLWNREIKILEIVANVPE